MAVAREVEPFAHASRMLSTGRGGRGGGARGGRAPGCTQHRSRHVPAAGAGAEPGCGCSRSAPSCPSPEGRDPTHGGEGVPETPSHTDGARRCPHASTRKPQPETTVSTVAGEAGKRAPGSLRGRLPHSQARCPPGATRRTARRPPRAGCDRAPHALWAGAGPRGHLCQALCADPSPRSAAPSAQDAALRNGGDERGCRPAPARRAWRPSILCAPEPELVRVGPPLSLQPAAGWASGDRPKARSSGGSAKP